MVRLRELFNQVAFTGPAAIVVFVCAMISAPPALADRTTTAQGYATYAAEDEDSAIRGATTNARGKAIETCQAFAAPGETAQAGGDATVISQNVSGPNGPVYMGPAWGGPGGRYLAMITVQVSCTITSPPPPQALPQQPSQQAQPPPRRIQKHRPSSNASRGTRTTNAHTHATTSRHHAVPKAAQRARPSAAHRQEYVTGTQLPVANQSVLQASKQLGRIEQQLNEFVRAHLIGSQQEPRLAPGWTDQYTALAFSHCALAGEERVIRPPRDNGPEAWDDETIHISGTYDKFRTMSRSRFGDGPFDGAATLSDATVWSATAANGMSRSDFGEPTLFVNFYFGDATLARTFRQLFNDWRASCQRILP